MLSCSEGFAGAIGPKRTGKVMLGGFRSFASAKEEMEAIKASALAVGLSRETAEYLVTAYGARASEVIGLVIFRPELGRPISPNHPYIMAQAVYAAEEEGALTVDDVLSRRIRLTITDEKAAARAAAAVAFYMGDALDWSADDHVAQLRAFRQRLGA
jgi:glycerol-3-phosphate dehydrogenase